MHNDTQIHIKSKPFGEWTRSDNSDLEKFLNSKISVIQLTNERGQSIVLDMRIPLSQYAPDDIQFLQTMNARLAEYFRVYFST